MSGWLLTIDGCPYAFATAGVTAVTSWDSSGDSTTATILTGWLDPPDFEITELMHPTDGGLDWNGLAFRLHDLEAPSGPAADQRVVTWLATRDLDTQITQTVLAATIDDNDVTLTVADTSAFAASGTLWLDQEAITYTGTTATTFTGCGRGALGSRAIAHTIDADSSYYPVIYEEFPGLAERRAVWWRVTDGAAVRVYAGYCRDTPSLADDGVRFVVQTASAWERHREALLGNASATTRLRGFNQHSYGLSITHEDLARSKSAPTVTSATPDATDGVRDTAAAAFAFALSNLNAQYAADGFASNLTLTVARRGPGFQFVGNASGFGNVGTARIRIGASYNGVDSFVPTGSDPRRATAVLESAPSACLYYSPARPVTVVPVTSTTDLPTTWTEATYSDSPYTTTIRPVLRGTYGDDPVTIEAESVDAAARTVTGAVYVGAIPGPGEAPTDPYTAAYIEDAVPLRLALRVRSGHWVYALRRALVEDTTWVKSGIDPRDWDTSLVDTIAGVTAAGANAVEWYVDGETRFRDLVLPLLSMAGCGLGVRGGKLAPVPFRFAVDSDGTEATVTSDDLLVGEKPTWTVLRDGVVTAVEVTQNGASLLVQDRVAAARYGTGRPPVSVDLKGTSLTNALNPRDLAAFILSRLMGLWRNPVAAVTLPVTWSFGSALGAGDFVKIAEWLLPDGAGGRGLGNAAALALLGATEQRGFVYGRTLRPKSSSVLLHCLVFPRASGWAPCVRIASVDGTNKILTVATGYVGGTATDYAGSNLASYRFASTAANDGGTSWFTSGDRVQLVVRNSTTYTIESAVVSSVNAAAKTIEVVSAISGGMAATIGSGTVDLRYDDYTTAGLQDAQKAFAFVGGNTALDIGGTGDRAKRFAP